MRLARKTHYGMQLLTHLARHHNQWFSLTELADELKIPHSFLKHIAVALKRSRILDSQGGMRGGYCLSRDPQTITIAMIFKSLDEELNLLPCRTKHCTHRTCLTGHFWETVTGNLRQAFENSTLEIMAKMQ